MSSFIFRGFIPASSSWIYWQTGETQPDGVTLISTAKTLVTKSINFSSSLNTVSDLTSSLQYNFEFTRGIIDTITNVTDSVSGFIVNGGSDVANGWEPLLIVSTGSYSGNGIPSLSQFAFAGSNNRKFTASGSNGLILTSSFSVEIVTKHNTSLGSTWNQIAGNHPNTSWTIFKQGAGAPNKIRFSFMDSALNAYATNSIIDLPLQEWIHLVCTREVVSSSSTFVTQSIYINGQIDNTESFILTVPPIYTGSQTFLIGGNTTTSDNWNGEVVYVRIYNKKLHQNEVKQLYFSSLGEWHNDWFNY